MDIEKYMALRNDENVYHECREQTKFIHSKAVKQLLDLEISIGPNFKDQCIKLQPPGDNGPLARFYGLPKIHKVNIPFRPIVSTCGISI